MADSFGNSRYKATFISKAYPTWYFSAKSEQEALDKIATSCTAKLKSLYVRTKSADSSKYFWNPIAINITAQGTKNNVK